MKQIKEGKRGTFWIGTDFPLPAHTALKELCISAISCSHCAGKARHLLHQLNITCGDPDCVECYEDVEANGGKNEI